MDEDEFSFRSTVKFTVSSKILKISINTIDKSILLLIFKILIFNSDN